MIVTATIAREMAAGLVALALAAAPARGSGATAPASQPAAGPAEMKILRDLEAAGEKHRTIRAEIDYRVDLRALGDSEERTGWVAYRKGDAKQPTTFRVTFETLKQGAGRRIKSQVDYAFDGQWLTVAKHKIRNMTLYQLAAKGQRIEPLRIGKGPFPLPFGQQARDVLEHFIPSTRPPRSSDPKNTTYLRLDARPQRAKDAPAARLELWIDAKTHLPVKIRSRAKNKDVTTVTFKNIRTNEDVSPSVFRIPRRLGWQVIRRPLKGTRGLTP